MAIATRPSQEKVSFAENKIGGTSHPTLYKMTNISYRRQMLIFYKYVVPLSSNHKSIVVSCLSSVLIDDVSQYIGLTGTSPLNSPNLSIVVTWKN
jgi:hypothetical protein